jgi:hypothetical protein
MQIPANVTNDCMDETIYMDHLKRYTYTLRSAIEIAILTFSVGLYSNNRFVQTTRWFKAVSCNVCEKKSTELPLLNKSHTCTIVSRD